METKRLIHATKTIWYCPDCEKIFSDSRLKKCRYCGGINCEDEDGRLWSFVEGTNLEGKILSKQILAYNNGKN